MVVVVVSVDFRVWSAAMIVAVAVLLAVVVAGGVQLMLSHIVRPQ